MLFSTIISQPHIPGHTYQATQTNEHNNNNNNCNKWSCLLTFTDTKNSFTFTTTIMPQRALVSVQKFRYEHMLILLLVNILVLLDS